MNNQLLYSAVNIGISLSETASGNAGPTPECTGFIVQGRDAQQYHLISNRHALEPKWGDSKYIGYEVSSVLARLFLPPKGMPDALPSATVAMQFASDAIVHHDDSTVDISGIPVRKRLPLMAEVHLSYFVPITMIADASVFATQLHAGEIVFFPGYPAWRDRNGDRPVLRYGAIISDPRNDYRIGESDPVVGDGSQQFAFEALSVSGNSGSPVFVAERGLNVGHGLTSSEPYRPVKLIGVNAGHYSTGASQHAGVSRAHKSTAILELIDKLDAS